MFHNDDGMIGEFINTTKQAYGALLKDQFCNVTIQKHDRPNCR